MAAAPLSFLARLLRPFNQSVKMNVSTSTNGAASEAGSAINIPEGAEQATVAAGCFWGVEHLYRKHFGNKGLYDARVGYIGGDTSNPSYKNVCSGNTGHAEATRLIYDPSKITYTQLLDFFYRMHDPTTLNQQGPDRGTQYRSGIFFHTPEQEKTAREITLKVQEQWYKGKPITTEILPASTWWDAETYHQEYLTKNPYGYECPSHFLRTFPELK